MATEPPILVIWHAMNGPVSPDATWLRRAPAGGLLTVNTLGVRSLGGWPSNKLRTSKWKHLVAFLSAAYHCPVTLEASNGNFCIQVG